ncbi:MAG: biopolymer transporter ExbD [Rhizobacter sp.]
MAMNLGSSSGDGDPDVMVEMNTTPLIDVMLVLLIMLIITIPIQLHSVNLNMPAGNPPPPPVPPQVVTVLVDADGAVFWDGDRLPDRQALETRLAAAAALPVQPELHIRPNKLAEYKAVAMVLASAQRLGVTKLGMVGNEQFIN